MINDLNRSQIKELIEGMHAAYNKGENAMAYAREKLAAFELSSCCDNNVFSALIAYDLQSGSYIQNVCSNIERNLLWCEQIAKIIFPILPDSGSILEVGVGEATTLTGVLKELNGKVGSAYGFDISWSRISMGKKWMKENKKGARLFVADLMNIPFADDSIDVVYSSHSLEPNGGKEIAALSELLRVARHSVVLIEPIYELASDQAKARMRSHGYVRNLKESSEKLGADVFDYRLLKHISNPLNPSGVLSLRKKSDKQNIKKNDNIWQCPITGELLTCKSDVYLT